MEFQRVRIPAAPCAALGLAGLLAPPMVRAPTALGGAADAGSRPMTRSVATRAAMGVISFPTEDKDRIEALEGANALMFGIASLAGAASPTSIHRIRARFRR